MTRVRFYDAVPEETIGFAVIATQVGEQWVYCRHRQRTTWEIPGGHREAGETLEETACRELQEETDARDFTLMPVCVYSVQKDGGEETFGSLWYARAAALGGELHSEIACAELFAAPPENQTYPEIQPALHARVLEWLEEHHLL